MILNIIKYRKNESLTKEKQTEAAWDNFKNYPMLLKMIWTNLPWLNNHLSENAYGKLLYMQIMTKK